MPKVSILIFAISVIISSCVAFGSKTYVYNSYKLDKIKSIGLITKRADQPRNLYHNLIKAAFTNNLIQKLSEANLFRVVILDTMENETFNIDSFHTNENVDALLLAEWKLRYPEQNISDSKVELYLIDKDSKEVILKSSHNSNFGNSYWRTPLLPRTLLDATDDAIATLANHIRK